MEPSGNSSAAATRNRSIVSSAICALSGIKEKMRGISHSPVRLALALDFAGTRFRPHLLGGESCAVFGVQFVHMRVGERAMEASQPRTEIDDERPWRRWIVRRHHHPLLDIAR
jgi:hypothetical protein